MKFNNSKNLTNPENESILKGVEIGEIYNTQRTLNENIYIIKI